jgi:predicted ATPase
MLAVLMCKEGGKGKESFPYLEALKNSLQLSWLPKIYKGFFFRAETFLTLFQKRFNNQATYWMNRK